MKSAEDIRAMKGQEPVAMLTVYDYPTARALDRCGLDILLVGDSVAQNELGMERTSDLSLEMMLQHLGAAARGVETTHLLADLPYGSYGRPDDALVSARALMDAGANSVVLQTLEVGLEVAHHVAHRYGVTNAEIRSASAQRRDEYEG